MILAIDFDGTIHNDHHVVPGGPLGPPMPHAKRALTAFKDAGHKIVIHSVFAVTHADEVREWMHKHQIPFDSIEPKFRADVYIDDHGVHFDTWDAIENLVHENEHDAFVAERW
jgi:hypothetical protein